MGRVNIRLLWAAISFAGCVSNHPTPLDAGALEAAAELADARVEVYVLDAWGRAISPDDSTKVEVSYGNLRNARLNAPRTRFALAEPGELTISAATRNYVPLTVKLRYAGPGQAGGLVKLQENTDRTGVVIGTQTSPTGTIYHVYLGLPHRWFAASGPAFTADNELELLLDGETIHARLREELLAARRTVNISTWWWESDFELLRPEGAHVTMSSAARYENSIMRTVERSPAQKRVLVGQFFNQDGSLANLTSDAALEGHARTPGDNFEMMGQANPARGAYQFTPTQPAFQFRVQDHWPTAGQAFAEEDVMSVGLLPRVLDLNAWPIRLPVPHASMHQKFATIDGRVAYISGANFRKTDWDTNLHLLHDPRRSDFATPQWQRAAIQRGEFMSNVHPRKDYALRIVGSAAQQADAIFARRWQQLRQQGVRFSDQTSNFQPAAPAPGRGRSQVQLTETFPAPNQQNAIAESWLNAISQAQRYIYIEDQYFRAPLLVDAIIARMTAVPNLQLVVITKPVSRSTDPGCVWTHLTSEALAQRFGARYHLFTLRTWGMEYYDPTEQEEILWGWTDSMKSRFEDIDVHSKVLMVDDTFMSVGSANKNNRGMLFEAELNAAVFDPAFVTGARRTMLYNILPDGVAIPNDALGWIQALEQAAATNDNVATRWQRRDSLYPLNTPVAPDLWPKGFVYHLQFGAPQSCLLAGVGPDMT